MAQPPADDVIVVGGGIIGLSIAREAARSGLRVRLLEKGEIGREASAAAAGLIGPQLGAERADPLLSLGLASRDLYPAFARAIAEESGIDPALLERGTLVLARGGDEVAEIDRQCAFQRSIGLAAERMGGEALRRLEPSLDPGCSEGLHLPRDWSLDNVRLVQGLRRAAEQSGVLLLPGSRVDRLLVENGRVVGVEAGAGRFRAGAVVIAAGAWSEEIAGAGVPPLPSHPVRGQIVCLGPAAAPQRPLYSHACYIVPRRDGRVLVGSTMERAGFDRSVTAAGLATLTAAAIQLVPVLRDAPFHSAWAGLRPATGDGLPAIGRGAAPGLLYACGHLRGGLLLAPITARVVTRLLHDEDPGFDLAPFDPRRFLAAARGRENN
jgi:glycine oxidase